MLKNGNDRRGGGADKDRTPNRSGVAGYTLRVAGYGLRVQGGPFYVNFQGFRVPR